MTWSTKKLGEIASVRTGKLDANAADDGGAYLFYTCSREISKINDTAFDGESILISGNGEFWVKYHEDGKFNAYQRTYVIQTSDDVFAKYLFLKLTEEVPKLVSQGAIIKYLRLPQLKNIEIPLPPIAEQRRIVEKLEKQFAKIDEAARLRAESLEATDQLLPAALHEIFSEGKENGWRKGVFMDVCTLQRGFDLPKHSRIPGEYPLVSSSGIIDTHEVSKVKGPGVTVGRSGSIGSLTYVTKDYWPLNTVLYVKDFHSNDPRFVYYFLQNFGLKKYGTGTGVPTLNRNNLHGEPVTLPPLAEQKEIVKRLDALSEKVRALRELQLAQQADLKALKQSILHEAFAGEIQ